MAIETPAELLTPVINIACQAGAKILEIYDTEFTVAIKDDTSPLTTADMAAHHCIVEKLSALADYPILSEESADIPFDQRCLWQTYWLVDPLDGTKEFIKRNGDFTVNIALIHRHQPVLGVVYVPVRQECFYATQGVGAFKQCANEPAEKIAVRSLLPGKLVVAGSRSHVTPELERYLNNLPDHKLLSRGSSLKFCLVAEGTADIYPRMGLTSEWDTGAAQCIVEEAGGAVTELNGEVLQYNLKDSLLNPYFLVFGDKNHDWSGYV